MDRSFSQGYADRRSERSNAGFALGPAAEKGAVIVSGLLAGTPFYVIGTFLLVTFLVDAQNLHRHVLREELVISSVFLVVGIAFSIVQAARVRRHSRRREHTTEAM